MSNFGPIVTGLEDATRRSEVIHKRDLSIVRGELDALQAQVAAMPKGIIGQAAGSFSSTALGAGSTTNMHVAFNINHIAGRKYRFCGGRIRATTGAGTILTCTLNLNGTRLEDQWNVITAPTAYYGANPIDYLWTAPSTATSTVQWVLTTTAAFTVFSEAPFYVEDLGT